MSRTVKKPYTKSKRFAKSCRCHGGCGYCLNNRMYQYNKNIERFFRDLKEYKEGK